MLFDEANEVLELLRGNFPIYFIFFLPVLILVSPLSPVHGAHDFAVYRMQHFDLQGNSRGCRSALINLEARTLDVSSYTRKCVLARLLELTPSKFREVIGDGGGGLVVLVPGDLSSLSADDRKHVYDLEYTMLLEETSVPVYFAVETPELSDIYEAIKYSSASEQATSAAEALMGSLSSTGFQMVVSTGQAKAYTDTQISNIQGKLPGYGIEEQLPTIALVAHYDSFGISPSLSFGGDSNGSGVVALLELARLLSRLYANSRSHARFNILFLLSGAGKFNFQGTKKWIEDNLDSAESSLLQDAVYTLCLDSIGNGKELLLHVSKPPKEGSPGWILLQELKNMAKQFYPDMVFDMVHKKINLADDTLAWEHERFSIRRLPAFTLSHLNNPKDLQRNSILDTRDQVDVQVLQRNIKVIAEALARHVYNITNSHPTEIFTDSMCVQPDHLTAWMDYLTNYSRAAQVLAEPERHPVISALEQALSKFLKDVTVITMKPDKRDPEVMFYDALMTTMTAYSVKPAVFDLVLFAAVAVYLCILYFLIQGFPQFYYFLISLSSYRMKQT